jgi:hypothetical protein
MVVGLSGAEVTRTATQANCRPRALIYHRDSLLSPYAGRAEHHPIVAAMMLL